MLVETFLQLAAHIRTIRWNEEHAAGHHGGEITRTNTLEQQIQRFEENHMINLACALKVVTSSFDVAYPGQGLSQATTIVNNHSPILNKFWADATGVIVFNTFANRFAVFTEMFYQKLLE